MKYISQVKPDLKKGQLTYNTEALFQGQIL